MDKSEGTDFLSKTFSKVTDRVAQWYHSSQKRVSIATLKRAKNEKLLSLGLKTFELITAGAPITLETLREDFEAVERINRDIAQEEGELNTINSFGSGRITETKAEEAPKVARKSKKKLERTEVSRAHKDKKRGRPTNQKQNAATLAVEDKSDEKADPRLLPMAQENGESDAH